MDDAEQRFWDMAFISVCAIQFHPRNKVLSVVDVVERSSAVADEMLYERQRRQVDSDRGGE